MSEGTGYEQLSPDPRMQTERPAGLPDATFSQELADRICDQISDGPSLRSVCTQSGFPNRQTVFRWLRENEEFADQFDRARKEGAHALVDDMHAIADDKTDDPNSRRIRVDTRKWIASKMLPKVYGEKMAVTDSEGGPLIVAWATAPGVVEKA